MARRLPQRARLALSTVGRHRCDGRWLCPRFCGWAPASVAFWEHLGLPSVL